MLSPFSFIKTILLDFGIIINYDLFLIIPMNVL